MTKKTFYQQDSHKKVRQWSIWVENNPDGTATLFTESGIAGGQLITTPTPITAGKNIGRANETTAQAQAILDANTEIAKKVKRGYVDDISKIKSKGETATIKAPMKGYAYSPTGADKGLTLDKLKIRGKKVGIQRKLDGWRFRIHVDRNDITFYTSSGDLTLEFPQITASIRASFDKIIDYVSKKYGVEEYYLDGEIYNHALGFQPTASACGAGKNKVEQEELSADQKALRDKMHFHLFDVCLDVDFPVREKILEYFYSDVVKQVETLFILAEDDVIDQLFVQFLGEGYEGLMIRQLDMPYEFKRSKQLTKYKPLMDDEAQVVDFEESIQKNTLGALVCVLPDGRTFNTNLKDDIGSDKMKKEIWDNQADYRGKWVTYEFLGWTDDKKPRHPRAKAFRAGKSKD